MYGLHPAATPPSSDPYAGRVPVNGIPYPSGYPLYNPDNLRRTPYDPFYAAVTPSSTTVAEDTTTTTVSTNGYVKFGGSGGDGDGPGGATVGILVVVRDLLNYCMCM